MVEAIGTGTYDLVVLNFANPDMVGHTGSLPAAIKAVETVDAALGRIVAAVRAQGGALLVTADHGNCELMKDPSPAGRIPPIPPIRCRSCWSVGRPAARLADGRLADVAPTLLALMGQPQPAAMTGVSLLRRARSERGGRRTARAAPPCRATSRLS